MAANGLRPSRRQHADARTRCGDFFIQGVIPVELPPRRDLLACPSTTRSDTAPGCSVVTIIVSQIDSYYVTFDTYCVPHHHAPW